MADLPWTARQELRLGEHYVVMASHLPLKRLSATFRFFRGVMAVRRQLASASGLVGYSLRARIGAKRYWTLSVWADEASLREFMRAPPHVDLMTALHPVIGRTRFVQWTITSEDGLPTWSAPTRRLETN